LLENKQTNKNILFVVIYFELECSEVVLLLEKLNKTNLKTKSSESVHILTFHVEVDSCHYIRGQEGI